MLTLPAATTALVLIDLQKGIVGLPLEPRSGDSVVAAARRLANRFRLARAPIVLVNVAYAKDFGDALKAPVDHPAFAPSAGFAADWTELADGVAEPTDLRITKRQWGAFYGTDLDLQLRRRGIATIVLGGISTNQGVESTARAAHEHGYAVVFAEDVTTGLTAHMHGFAFEHIFPRLGRVVDADSIALTA